MARVRAFVQLGSSTGDPPRRLEAALRHLAAEGERIAAVSPARWSPHETAPGVVDGARPPVLDAVAELVTERSAPALLGLLHHVEAREGRRRAGPDAPEDRRLDLDLLAWGDVVGDEDGVRLPHPRATARAFVLDAWEAIAPLAEVPGTGLRVVEHAARLRARDPASYERLGGRAAIGAPTLGGTVARLETPGALDAWRRARPEPGLVGVVPTMGALHPGHASLIRRARAECDHVLVTLFVNPLQFGPDEDLARYPRTLEADLDVLRAEGADAVFLPAPETLYPAGFATYVVPEGPATGLEGAERPGHFRGVATVVLKLWNLCRPDRAYFGRKDAQQLAVLRRMARDLDLAGAVVAGETVREVDGLALSSRNRYLAPAERSRALALSATLDWLTCEVAGTTKGAGELAAAARARLVDVGLAVDYLEIVDPDTMTPSALDAGPALAVATVRVGGTRLLDNRWVARARREASA